MREPVTIQDFIKPEFRGADPQDYERREDGAIVRKDRWETGIRRIAIRICGSGNFQYEIENLVTTVEWLMDQIPDQSKNLLGEKP